jgi:hypothetical protein
MALQEERERRYTQVAAERAKFFDERDRRYTEVGIEREKALQIKEQADRDALALARADQTYKDERANNLRTQIESERGDYATKADLRALTEKVEALVSPLASFVTQAQGSRAGHGEARLNYNAVVSGISLVIVIVLSVVTLIN